MRSAQFRGRRAVPAYTRFRAAFRSEAQETLRGLESPDWARIFARSRETSAPAHRASPLLGLPLPGLDGPLLPTARRRTARWLPIGMPARAALLVVVLGLGGLTGYRQYRLLQARSLVRSQTTEFVNSLFSSSLFSASVQSPLSEPIESAWFILPDETTGLPIAPFSPLGKRTRGQH